MKPKRNPWALIGWCVVWWLVFWTGGLFIVGFVAGASHPGHGAEAGRAAGQTWTAPVFLLSLILSIVLTVLGVMPGTRHRSGARGRAGNPDVEVFGDRVDLEALERLGRLHREGVLTDDEFSAQKATVLSREA
jgi:hypothetical protein